MSTGRSSRGAVPNLADDRLADLETRATDIDSLLDVLVSLSGVRGVLLAREEGCYGDGLHSGLEPTHARELGRSVHRMVAGVSGSDAMPLDLCISFGPAHLFVVPSPYEWHLALLVDSHELVTQLRQQLSAVWDVVCAILARGAHIGSVTLDSGIPSEPLAETFSDEFHAGENTGDPGVPLDFDDEPTGVQALLRDELESTRVPVEGDELLPVATPAAAPSRVPANFPRGPAVASSGYQRSPEGAHDPAASTIPAEPDPAVLGDPQSEYGRVMRGPLAKVMLNVRQVFLEHASSGSTSTFELDEAFRREVEDWAAMGSPSPYSFPLLVDALSDAAAQSGGQVGEFSMRVQAIMHSSDLWSGAA